MLSYLLPGSNQIPGRSPFSLQGYVPFGWKPTEEALRCNLVVISNLDTVTYLQVEFRSHSCSDCIEPTELGVEAFPFATF